MVVCCRCYVQMTLRTFYELFRFKCKVGIYRRYINKREWRYKRYNNIMIGTKEDLVFLNLRCMIDNSGNVNN